MSEKTQIAVRETAAFFLAAVLIFGPLYMASYIPNTPRGSLNYPGDAYQPSNQTYRSKQIPSPGAPPFNDAGGVIQVQIDQCYQRETVGECAARRVQNSVVGFYFLLFLVGAAQVFAAFLTWRLLVRQAETLPRIERAYILPDPPDITTFKQSAAATIYDKMEDTYVPFLTIRFGNFGRSPAIITATRGEIIIGSTIPVAPNYDKSTETRDIRNVPAGGYTPIIPITLGRPFTIEERAQQRGGTLEFYVFGYVEYVDIINQLCVKAFCFRMGKLHGPGELAGGHAYNYIKRQQAPRELWI